MFRDYCGMLSEETIRKNFVLIYEIIEETFDFGHAQLVTTEAIRPYIVNEPVIITPKKPGERSKSSKSEKTPSTKKSWKFFKSNTQSASAIQKPI